MIRQHLRNNLTSPVEVILKIITILLKNWNLRNILAELRQLRKHPHQRQQQQQKLRPLPQQQQQQQQQDPPVNMVFMYNFRPR
jgi:hypothetical protein